MGRQPGTTGWFGRLVAAPLLLSALVAGTLVLVHDAVDADELLQNGGFEAWNGANPANWSVLSGSASRDDGRSVAGAALHVTGSQPEALVQQIVQVSPNSALDASVGVSSDAAATVTLALYPLDDGFVQHGLPTSVVQTIPAGDEFATVSATIPKLYDGAVYVRMQVSVRTAAGTTLSVYFDQASLVETLAPPTATPTPSPPPSATSTAGGGASPTATQQSGANPTSTPRAATPTKTAKPTKTPTRKPTATPRPKAIKTPTPTPQPKRTPTPSNPDATTAGLLLNGDFEALDNGKPAYWAKYGGEMGATGDAYDGRWSATLSSTTTSTKWLSQVVSIEGGAWYRLTASARAENATAFLRISWYASGDGSGSQIESADGGSTTSSSWANLDTGAVQAPPDAGSARIKLMLRPAGGSGRVLFDDAWFAAAEPLAATATATSTARPVTATRTATPRKGATRTPTPKGKTPSAGRTSGSGPSGDSPSKPPPASLGDLQVSGDGTLRLSEFMSDPPRTGSDGPDEWVEVVNTGTETLSTAGWQISDAKSADAIPEIEVPSGGYLVIAGRSAEIPNGVPVVRVADGTIGNGLNNNGDVIALIAPSGETVDAISYGDNTSVFEPPPPEPDAGKTTGTRAPGAEEAAVNWDVTLEPSPGAPNLFPDDSNDRPGNSGNKATPAPDNDEPPGDAPAAPRQLVPESGRDGAGLGTLDWLVVGALLMGLGAAAPVAVRRFGQPLWKRIHRDR